VYSHDESRCVVGTLRSTIMRGRESAGGVERRTTLMLRGQEAQRELIQRENTKHMV
jgi:hypothetical protein